MNILISNISKIRTKKVVDTETNEIKEIALIETNTYDSADDNIKDIKGVITNEAPIKMLIQQLCDSSNDKLDYVFAVTSGLVKKEYENIKKTSYDVLQENIKAFCGEKYFVPQFRDFDITDEPNNDDVIKTVMELDEALKDEIEKAQKKDAQINVYIESNGGIRYVLTMLLSICNALEREYNNFNIKQIFSMVFGDNPIKVLETKRIFDSMQVPTIVNEYLSYGRTKELKKYFAYIIENKNEKYSQEKAIIDKLDELSDNIFLCRIELILQGFYGEDNIGQLIDEYLNNDTLDDIELFRHVVETIQSDLKKYLYNYDDVINSRDENKKEKLVEYLPNVINWCLAKDYIQQALTLSAERYPLYMKNKRYFGASQQLEARLAEKSGITEKYMYLFANMNMILSKYCETAKLGPYIMQKDSKEGFSLLNEDSWELLARMHNERGRVNNYNYKIVNTYYDFLKNMKELLLKKSKLKDIEKVLTNNNVEKIYKKGLSTGLLHLDSRSGAVNVTQLSDYDIDIEYMMTAVVDKIFDAEVDLSDDFKDDVESVYNNLVKKLYDKAISKGIDGKAFIGLLDEEYKNKYINNYNIKRYSKIEQFKDECDCDILQEKVFLWVLCKEQRNLANHAAGTKKSDVVLDSEHLSILIKELIRAL